MTTKKPKENISGWIILNKPAGPSSTQALSRVRWLLNAAKAGHGGTLDPFATGVLPLAFGEATKMVSHVLDGKKSYRFTLRWGIATDSDDATGKIIAEHPHRPTREAIMTALPGFTGTIQQIPPQFSALHVDGQRAYDLARVGETIKLAARTLAIARFEFINQPDADQAVFEVDCSKGTYVRALARDLGAALGTLAHVNQLQRLSCGPFNLSHAISLEKIEEIMQKDGGPERFQAFLHPLATVLDDIPALAVNEMETRRLRQGQNVVVHPLRITAVMQQSQIIAACDHRDVVALVTYDGTALKPQRVFNDF